MRSDGRALVQLDVDAPHSAVARSLVPFSRGRRHCRQTSILSSLDVDASPHNVGDGCGCGDRLIIASPARPTGIQSKMLNRTGCLLAGVTLTVLSTLTPISLGSGSAEAAVYCKTAGVPDGCVARPTAAVGAPGRADVAGVGANAPSAGVRAGTPMNRGGPVNRAGHR